MNEQLELSGERFDPVEWITTTEAAELTGYTIHNIHKARQRGAIKAIKRGNMLFFRRDDVLQYALDMKDLGKQKYIPKTFRDSAIAL